MNSGATRGGGLALPDHDLAPPKYSSFVDSK